VIDKLAEVDEVRDVGSADAQEHQQAAHDPAVHFVVDADGSLAYTLDECPH
jgi:hypothetical protein